MLYYLWVKDAVGNVRSQTIKVNNIEISINGQITWNDQNNKYNSRVAQTVKIYRKTATSGEELINTMNITAGQTSWTLATRECNDAGEQYQFIARGNAIPGYESVTSGKNITNNLILPNFTANLDSAPLNSFENKYLKNGKVKIWV